MATLIIFHEVNDGNRWDRAWPDVLGSDEGKKAVAEDGLKVETLRMLTEFTP